MTKDEFVAYWCANAGISNLSELPYPAYPSSCDCGGYEEIECHGWTMEFELNG